MENFEIYHSCEANTKSSPKHLTQFPWALTSSCYHSPFVAAEKPGLVQHCQLQAPITFHRYFHSRTFSVPQSMPRHHTALSHRVSFISFDVWQFFRFFPCYLMTLTVWRNRSQGFLFSLWVLSDVFLMTRPGLWVWGRIPQRQGTSSSCHTRGHISSSLGTCHANLEHLARWCLLGFSAVNSPLSLFTCTLIWKLVSPAHTDGRG